MMKLTAATLALAFSFALGCSKDKDVIEKPPAKPAELPAEQLKGRRIDIQVNKSGYKPEQVEVKTGEEVTLVFTMVEETECGREVVIPSTQAHAKLELNKPTPIPFKATQPGPVSFTCGMAMMKGTLIVN
jgi:plastocyanin domain-containing protein